MVLVHCALHDKMYSDIFLCSYVVDIRPVNCISCSHMFLCCTALLNKQFGALKVRSLAQLCISAYSMCTWSDVHVV